VHLKSDGYANYSLETLQGQGSVQVRDNVPILAFIGRVDYQKGVDLIAGATPWIVGRDVQLIMLGTGRKDLEENAKKI